MKSRVILPLAVLAPLLIAGCTRSQTGMGFHLPNGDPEWGQKAFVALRCTECHRVDGVELPAPTVAPEKVVVLGGDVTRLRSYGDLVTSIIHPSFEISERLNYPAGAKPEKSPMRNVNREMTVGELIDIVSFLHPRYRELRPLYPQELP